MSTAKRESELACARSKLAGTTPALWTAMRHARGNDEMYEVLLEYSGTPEVSEEMLIPPPFGFACACAYFRSREDRLEAEKAAATILAGTSLLE